MPDRKSLRERVHEHVEHATGVLLLIAVKQGLNAARFSLLEMHQRQTWRYFGYMSEKEFLTKELPGTYRANLRTIQCAQVLCILYDMTPSEANTNPPPDVKPDILLQLRRLPDDRIKEAMEEAGRRAQKKVYAGRAKRHTGKLTKPIVGEVVDELLDE